MHRFGSAPLATLYAVSRLPSLGVLLALSGSLLYLAGMMEPMPTVIPSLSTAPPDARSVPVSILSEAAQLAAAAPIAMHERSEGNQMVPVLPVFDSQTGFSKTLNCLKRELAERMPPAAAEREAACHSATNPGPSRTASDDRITNAFYGFRHFP